MQGFWPQPESEVVDNSMASLPAPSLEPDRTDELKDELLELLVTDQLSALNSRFQFMNDWVSAAERLIQ